jgi:hypothetical protein
MFLTPGTRQKAGGKPFPTGTQMMFVNAAAPLGWTRVTTFDDALLRIVGSTTPGSGGSNGFVATVNGQTGTGTGSTGTGSTGTGTTGTANTGTGTTGTGTTGTGTSGSTSLTTANLASHLHQEFVSTTGCSGNTVQAAVGTNSVGTNSNTGSQGSGTGHTHTVPGLSVPGLSVPALTIPGLSIPALTIPALTVPSLSVSFSIKYVDALIAKKN